MVFVGSMAPRYPRADSVVLEIGRGHAGLDPVGGPGESALLLLEKLAVSEVSLTSVLELSKTFEVDSVCSMDSLEFGTTNESIIVSIPVDFGNIEVASSKMTDVWTTFGVLLATAFKIPWFGRFFGAFSPDFFPWLFVGGSVGKDNPGTGHGKGKFGS